MAAAVELARDRGDLVVAANCAGIPRAWRSDLAAERARRQPSVALPAVDVVLDLLEVEQFDGRRRKR